MVVEFDWIRVKSKRAGLYVIDKPEGVEDGDYS